MRKLEKAVGAYPQLKAAWWTLGKARCGIQDDAGAPQVFMRSIAADPKYLRLYEPLMMSAFRQKDRRMVQSFGLS